jgi:hypothetical protein
MKPTEAIWMRVAWAIALAGSPLMVFANPPLKFIGAGVSIFGCLLVMAIHVWKKTQTP